jgi:hypothetical protein
MYISSAKLVNGMAMASLHGNPSVLSAVEQETEGGIIKRTLKNRAFVCYFSQLLAKTELCRKILVKLSNTNSHENTSTGNRAVSSFCKFLRRGLKMHL